MKKLKIYDPWADPDEEIVDDDDCEDYDFDHNMGL